MTASGRSRSLDGLRGVAVIVVLLSHHALLNSGWFGVDLFFVLSGYLITSILRRARKDASYWKEFWIKRVTRILPPVLVLLVLCAVIFREPIGLLLACLFSLGDVAAVLRPAVETTRQLWSLAVEEHFYLLWPFAVRSLGRRRLIWLLLILVALSPLLRFITVVVFHPKWEVIYFLTPFRLDGLSLGSLLALFLESAPVTAYLSRWATPGTWGSAATYVAVRLLFGARFSRTANTAFYNAAVYFMVALFSFFLVAHLILRPRSPLSRALSWAPIVFIGQISYGLYLYQIVVRDLVMRFTHLSLRPSLLIAAPLDVLFAWLSFRVLEKPLILEGKRRAESYRRFSDAPLSVSTAP